MIISQTPYRVSFAGGGTDLPAFYQEEPGAVLSLTIAHHTYVTLHARFDPGYRVAYSRTEIAESMEDIRHDLVREALRLTEIDTPLEITTIGDVPSGSGLGSSSSLTVGLLHAMHAYQGQFAHAERLAAEACRIELDVLKKPIGRQDQYAAAFGGVNYIRFNRDGTTQVEPIPIRAENLWELERRCLLVYTEKLRSANEILSRQAEGTPAKMDTLREMRDLAGAMREALIGRRGLDEFGELLHEGWCLKRSLGFGITSGQVDDWYSAARRAGAQGGKLLGAGGGGFVLLLAPPDRHTAILEALGRPRTLEFKVDRMGSRIVFTSASP